MDRMFQGATSFKRKLCGPACVHSKASKKMMFCDCSAGPQGAIREWNVSSVHDMSRVFSGANSFNDNIAAWDVSSVADMTLMFSYGNCFNGDIS